MALQIEQIAVLNDNYNYILIDESTGKTAVVDPSTAEDTKNFLESRGLHLDVILNTHHHFDHIGGNKGLIETYGCEVVGSKFDHQRIHGITTKVGEGDRYLLGDTQFRVMEVFGHTLGHIAFFSEADEALFPGDALFSVGCGRLFEGSAEQLFDTLQKLSRLPPSTNIYCAHEYTLSNIKFAKAVDPTNEALGAYEATVEALRQHGRPTIPCMLERELEVNPFLRWDDEKLRNYLGLRNANPVEVIRQLRQKKDAF